MNEKIYKCECGKEFTKPNSFNGHKSRCRIHAEAKGTWDKIQPLCVKAGNATAEKYVPIFEAAKQVKLQHWIDEKHTCEKCGKIMTVKYGSGRFCSQSCANGRPKLEQERNRISEALKNSDKNKENAKAVHMKAVEEYSNHPKMCAVCESVLPYAKREKVTCCDSCYRKLRADIRFRTIEKIGLNHGNKPIYKFGFYKGIECDSGWELAFLLYHLYHENNIKRNSDYFTYQFDGIDHRYYPDFIIDDTYYEVKGYKDDRFFEKVKQFPSNLKLVIIDYTKINDYIKFVVNQFGEDFCTLYDSDKPNWLNTRAATVRW